MFLKFISFPIHFYAYLTRQLVTLADSIKDSLNIQIKLSGFATWGDFKIIFRQEATSRSNAGNTKGGSITLPLTSCLTGLESAVWQQTTDNFYFYFQNRLIQSSQSGGQYFSNTSPFSIPCPMLLKQDPTIEFKNWIVLHLGRLWPYSQTLDLAGKACQEHTF